MKPAQVSAGLQAHLPAGTAQFSLPADNPEQSPRGIRKLEIAVRLLFNKKTLFRPVAVYFFPINFIFFPINFIFFPNNFIFFPGNHSFVGKKLKFLSEKLAPEPLKPPVLHRHRADRPGNLLLISSPPQRWTTNGLYATRLPSPWESLPRAENETGPLPELVRNGC